MIKLDLRVLRGEKRHVARMTVCRFIDSFIARLVRSDENAVMVAELQSIKRQIGRRRKAKRST